MRFNIVTHKFTFFLHFELSNIYFESDVCDRIIQANLFCVLIKFECRLEIFLREKSIALNPVFLCSLFKHGIGPKNQQKHIHTYIHTYTRTHTRARTNAILCSHKKKEKPPNIAGRKSGPRGALRHHY